MTPDNSVKSWDTAKLKRQALDHLWMPYTQWTNLKADGGPTVLVKAEGCRVWDSEGKPYLDGISALEASIVGHRNPEIIAEASRQMTELDFMDVFRYANPAAIQLAAKLAEIAPGNLSKVHFTPGGSEAVDTAIKMARQYHCLNGESSRYKLISRKGAYHGCTFGAMMADGHIALTNTHYFEPLVPGRLFAPPPSHYRSEFGKELSFEEASRKAAQAIEDMIIFERKETVAAVIVDPATTYQGVSVPHACYLQMVRDICTRYGVLLIADEIISGFGRTGRMFCSEHAGVVPDIMTVSKGLTSGYVPQGAVIATDVVAAMFAGGSERAFAHGQTYGAHPVACAVGLKNIEIIERDNLIGKAQTQGAYLLERLQALSRHATFGEARGIGLLCGLELVGNKDTRQIIQPAGSFGRAVRLKCKEYGLITLTLWPGDTLLFAPSLIISTQEIDELVGIVDKALSAVEKEWGFN